MTPGITIEIVSLPSKNKEDHLCWVINWINYYKNRSSLRKRRTPISSHMVIGVARGLLLKHNRRFLDDFGGPITLTKD